MDNPDEAEDHLIDSGESKHVPNASGRGEGGISCHRCRPSKKADRQRVDPTSKGTEETSQQSRNAYEVSKFKVAGPKVLKKIEPEPPFKKQMTICMSD